MTREQKQKAKGTEHRTITFATWNVRTLVEMLGVTDGSADLGQGLDLAPKYQTPLVARITWTGN